MSDFDEVFARWWAVLLGRFGTEKPKTVAAFYRDTLAERLSTAELAAAMERVAYSARFFPAPAEIVEAVRSSGRAKAIDDWDRVVAWIKDRDDEAVRALSPEGRDVAESMGLLERAGSDLRTRDFIHVRRQFLEDHEALTGDRAPLAQLPGRQRRALPPTGTEG